MLYLIGLGLNKKGISIKGLEAVKRCKKIYLENYTVELPYSIEDLSENLGKKVVPFDRNKVEGLEFLDEARKTDIALLVYGSPLIATTHMTILNEAKKSGIKTKVIHSASILDGVAESGLQLYKFGKIASLPDFEAESFMKIVKENREINAHSLILVDIGLEFNKAIEKLENAAKNHEIEIDKIIVGSKLGTEKSKILYRKTIDLKDKNIESPFCIIIPGELHFTEKEFLED